MLPNNGVREAEAESGTRGATRNHRQKEMVFEAVGNPGAVIQKFNSEYVAMAMGRDCELALSSRPDRHSCILSLIESLWLQTAPLQHLVFQRFGVQELPDRHEDLLDAIADGNVARVRLAIRQDIEEGLGSISAEELL